MIKTIIQKKKNTQATSAKKVVVSAVCAIVFCIMLCISAGNTDIESDQSAQHETKSDKQLSEYHDDNDSESEENVKNNTGGDSEDKNEENVEKGPDVLFAEQFSDISKCSTKTGKSLYSLLTKKMLFDDISNISKSDVGNINYDITADNYEIMASVDDDGIYRMICGDYVLYEDSTVKITKDDLDNRDYTEYQSEYYVIAKEIVTNNLIVPDSANFCAMYECAMQKNGDYVAVKGYLDSKNSLGTTIRNDFIVEFKVTDISSYSYETIYTEIGRELSGTFKSLD